ncbi:MAG: hypothetical protein R2874_00235 [Desulfobacterales bacterium]
MQHFRRMASESTVSIRRPRSFAGYEFITQTGATTIETLRGIRDFVTFIGALVLPASGWQESPSPFAPMTSSDT